MEHRSILVLVALGLLIVPATVGAVSVTPPDVSPSSTTAVVWTPASGIVDQVQDQVNNPPYPPCTPACLLA